MADSTITPEVLLAGPSVLFSRVQRGPLLRHHLGYIFFFTVSYSTNDESYWLYPIEGSHGTARVGDC
jgi:hypothetical protein